MTGSSGASKGLTVHDHINRRMASLAKATRSHIRKEHRCEPCDGTGQAPDRVGAFSLNLHWFKRSSCDGTGRITPEFDDSEWFRQAFERLSTCGDQQD